jgi:hypothetical protein
VVRSKGSFSRRSLRDLAQLTEVTQPATACGLIPLLSLLADHEVVEKAASECTGKRESYVQGKYAP